LGSGNSDAFHMHRSYLDVLCPLLEEDGYEIRQASLISDNGLDLVASREASATYHAQTIGALFKYYRQDRPVMGSQVQQLIGAAVTNAIDRAILLTNARYSKTAREMVQRDLPLQIELLDLDAIRAWVARLQVDGDIGHEVRELIRVISKEFAIRIARNPAALDHIEWRDLERTLAEIFDGIGFSVTLTPAAKDGGKDLILRCCVRARKAEYLVEVKHWRSRSRVGGGALRDFLKVVAREQSEGGLFLATYGYCDNAFEQLTEIDRERLRFGDEEKIVALARSYVKAQSGIWSPPENLVDVLFEGMT
jgi:restriction system protein